MKIGSKLLIVLAAGTLALVGGGIASAETAGPSLGSVRNADIPASSQSSPSGAETSLAAPVAGNIQGRDSGRCLDVRGGLGQGANATPVQVYDCLGLPQYNQRWTYSFVFHSTYWGRDVFQIKSQDTGSRCLDVRGGPGSVGNATPVQVYDCLGVGQTNQLWIFVSSDNGNGWQIIDYDSTLSEPKCLDVRGGPGQGVNATPVQIYDCLGANQTNQLWYIY
jgi:hypothetical protein